MHYVKDFFKKRTQRIVENDHELANDIEVDNINIGLILAIKYVLKTIKLVIIILNISYLTGIGFLVLCEGIDDFIYNVEFNQNGYDDQE
jgi:hypothetical protein